MKYFGILVIIIMITSCSDSNEKILSQTKRNLQSESGIGYTVNQLTTEGSTSIDTIFYKIKIDAIFKLFKSDSLIGYKFILNSSYLNPNFNILVKFTRTYNSSKYVTLVETEVENSIKEIRKSELKISDYKNALKGNIPMMLKILNYDGFNLVAKKDTILQNRNCIQISVIDDEEIPYDLFIDKKTSFPVFLRITENKTQPFIEEYNYTNFEHLDAIDDDAFEAKEIITSEVVKSFKIGDTLPSWKLNYLDGKKIDFNTTKGKTTILYLSMINCGYCQALTPYIKNLYKKYQNSDVQFLVFYPIDSKEKLDKYVLAKGIDFPIIYNSKENTKERFTIINKLKFGYPKTFILNKKNKAIWKFDGYSPKIEEIIEKELEKMNP